MPILHSFEENKLEYEDEDEVEIKMMGTEIDKESLEHNLYKNDITPIVCHNFSPTLNTPFKPKDSSIFRMKEFLKKENKFFTDPGDGVRINPDTVYPEFLPEDDVLPVEEQPLPVAALPTTESPGYIPESILGGSGGRMTEILRDQPTILLTE
ncbi:hypothetical protein Tco_0122822 [Tanacetum coccineum]